MITHKWLQKVVHQKDKIEQLMMKIGGFISQVIPFHMITINDIQRVPTHFYTKNMNSRYLLLDLGSHY